MLQRGQPMKTVKKGPVAIKNQVNRFITGKAQGSQKLGLAELLEELKDTTLPYNRELERDLVIIANDVLEKD
jgi:hypothetical protein